VLCVRLDLCISGQTTPDWRDMSGP